MLNKELINRKLANISKYLDELQGLSLKSYEIFTEEGYHYAAEKVIELMVTMAIDINLHIIKESGLMPPQRYKDSFLALGKKTILPRGFANKIAGSAGLRNLLIHHYEEVDLQKLYKDLSRGIKDYEKYCHYIEKFIARDRF